MGPDAFRVAGLGETLAELGLQVEDRGDVRPAAPSVADQAHLFALPQTVAWTEALMAAGRAALAVDDALPVFLGGDHALSLGTVAAAAADAEGRGKPLFLLWLDAHSDIHTPETTQSGHLHGTPVAYAAGLPGFGSFPPFPAPLSPDRICLFGIRSVDPAERHTLTRAGVPVTDMRVLDEQGIVAPLRSFLDRVAAAGGRLHVSLDVDFLDPGIAPGVVTTVPGGTTFREAHLVMELLHESGLVTSLDLVELNPFLDERGRTARLMVDLTASLLGRKVFDRPTTHA
jgi:arginase